MAQTESLLGAVSWSIVETVSGRELGAGHKDVDLEGMRVEKHRTPEGQTFYRKWIELTDPFAFALAEFPRRSAAEITGFGFIAVRHDVETMSWEWFNVSSPNEATKLQETGTIRFEIAQVGTMYEVVRTEFISDVSLRLVKPNGDPALEPSWRTIIRAGTVIDWPAYEP